MILSACLVKLGFGGLRWIPCAVFAGLTGLITPMAEPKTALFRLIVPNPPAESAHFNRFPAEKGIRPSIFIARDCPLDGRVLPAGAVRNLLEPARPSQKFTKKNGKFRVAICANRCIFAIDLRFQPQPVGG